MAASIRLLLVLAPSVAALALPPLVVPPAAGAALASYAKELVVHPLSTKVATACVLAVAGDALAQSRNGEPYDVRRASSFVVFDALYRGAFQHVTFPIIEDTIRGVALHQLLSGIPLETCAAIARTAANQLVIVPTVYYPLFFAVTAAVQGLSAKQGVERAKEKFWPLMSRNLVFWLPVQYVQFALIPGSWQVTYVCIMGLVWNVILSAVAGDAGEAAAEEAASLQAGKDLLLSGSVVPTLAAELELLPDDVALTEAAEAATRER